MGKFIKSLWWVLIATVFISGIVFFIWAMNNQEEPSGKSQILLPQDISPSWGKVVTDNETGEKMYVDEVSVSFNDGVSSQRMVEIVGLVGGEIVGAIKELRVYQIKLPNTESVTDVYWVIQLLQEYDEVEYAEPNHITELDD